MMNFFKHETAEVYTDNIGSDTYIWQFSVILNGAQIGKSCNINCHTFIEGDVILGDNVTVKSGVYLWSGMRIFDNVFIGPNVTFVNDKYPRSKAHQEKYLASTLQEGCSLGANATILNQITIGRYAMVGAGAVVTKNVPDFALVIGNPAKIVGWVNDKGEKLSNVTDSLFIDSQGNQFRLKSNILEKI